ncbi:MAG: toll/interleukin-1 receptor domain-containing protein [Rhodomicrobium sp.]
MTGSDIFISYVTADRDFAQELYEDLSSAGYTVWWDQELLAGEGFAAKIDQEIHSSKCVIVLWSEDSVRSRWVVGEAETAAHMNKLIPLLLNQTDPRKIASPGLRAIQAISFRDRKGLHRALDAFMNAPSTRDSIFAKYRRNINQSIRNVRRGFTPLRLLSAVLLVVLGGVFIHDYLSWLKIQASMNHADYEAYLNGSPPHIFGSVAHARISGKDEFEKLTASALAEEFNSFAR